MSFYRTLRTLARTPMIAPEPQAALGVQLTTFRESTSVSSSLSAPRAQFLRSISTSSVRNIEKGAQTGSTGPDTDEVAHTDEAYSGQADPEQSKKNVEGETGQSMETSAADSKASSKPSGKGSHDVEGSSSVKGGKPGQNK